MHQFPAVSVVVVLLLINTDIIVKSANTKELNDRIFSVIDDLFVSLKINTKMINPDNVKDYIAMHSFIQDVLYKNQGRYEEISNNIRTAINNKTANQISGVNEVIDEMIREQAVNNISSIRNDTVAYNTNETNKGFIDLVRLLNIKTKGLIPNDFSVWTSNDSQEVEGRRIFAGSNTAIARYPFMASVHVAGRFVCAGSLLHESLAISAASCLMRISDEPDLPIQIRLGSDYVTKMGYLVNIDRVIFHPNFERSTLANNLVLLKTKKSLRFIQRKVVAIKYDKWDFQLKDAKNIMILGWGKRGPADKSNDDQPLSRARLNLYDLEECKYIYNKEYVTDKTFCAGFVDRGDGACNHDGGGPALIGSLLSGIISFGSPRCGRVDAPTVFTRLGRYADWIDSVLDSVTISKGKLANAPQNFEVPESLEGQMGSEEIDAEIAKNSKPENPREILEQEFGIREILDGPIDTPKEEKSQYSTTQKQELGGEEIDIKKSEPVNLRDTVEREYDVTDILNGPIDLESSRKPNKLDTVQNTTSLPMNADGTNTPEHDRNKDPGELQLNTEQIIFSDDSEELTTLTQEDNNSLPILENGKEENKPSEAFADLMKELFDSTTLKNSVKNKMPKETTIDNVYLDFENEPPTTEEVESTTELEPQKISNQATNTDVAVMGKFRLNMDTNNTEPKEYMKLRETSRFDIQYQVEIKPIFVPISEKQDEKNNSIIILSEDGTTQRTKVNNAELFTNKLKTAMKALVKHMNIISAREHSDNTAK